MAHKILHPADNHRLNDLLAPYRKRASELQHQRSYFLSIAVTNIHEESDEPFRLAIQREMEILEEFVKLRDQVKQVVATFVPAKDKINLLDHDAEYDQWQKDNEQAEKN